MLQRGDADVVERDGEATSHFQTAGDDCNLTVLAMQVKEAIPYTV